jgi:adenylyl- and sulfurtransferase ThiI
MVDKLKVLALLSGGLDSMLAIKILLEQGLDVDAINFTTPFCLCDKCSVNSIENQFRIQVHRVTLGQEFLDLVVDPPHGYGSQMNPCIDCRILMLRKANALANQVGALCIVTGEVLNERPFSQRKQAMDLIEREAGLAGQILRPLSAKLLPETEFETSGQVNREQLFAIQGRRRLPQMRLAKERGIKGGCLLTDPQFTKRLRDFLKHNNNLTLNDVTLLKIGRHFRVEGCKVVVGRNEEENKRLLSIIRRESKSYLEVIDYMSPITLVESDSDDRIIETAAAITIRYSDAPKNIGVRVRYKGKKVNTLSTHAIDDLELDKLRIH